MRVGREGYTKIHGKCYDTAQYLAAEIEKLGPFEIIYDGNPEERVARSGSQVKGRSRFISDIRDTTDIPSIDS